MTVAELIEKLQAMPPEAYVGYYYDGNFVVTELELKDAMVNDARTYWEAKNSFRLNSTYKTPCQVVELS